MTAMMRKTLGMMVTTVGMAITNLKIFQRLNLKKPIRVKWNNVKLGKVEQSSTCPSRRRAGEDCGQQPESKRGHLRDELAQDQGGVSPGRVQGTEPPGRTPVPKRCCG